MTDYFVKQPIIYMKFLLITALLSTPSWSELIIIGDEDLSSVSGQMIINPLSELGDEIFFELERLAHQNSSEPITNSPYFNPLTSGELAKQLGQAIRVVHTEYPTGARSPDLQIGNINFWGRDYRAGDNLDLVTDCYANACGTGTDWDPDGDGIPGNIHFNINPNTLQANGYEYVCDECDDTAYVHGADGHKDDLYYEYDYYAAYGANGTVPDSTENWHFYRVESDALIKVVAHIDRLSQGGYTANYGTCSNAHEVVGDYTELLINNGSCGTGYSNYSSPVPGTEGDDDQNAYEQNNIEANYLSNKLSRANRDSYFSYDSEARNIQIGNLGCSNIGNARAEFLLAGGSYYGHCNNDERPFNPVTIKNPYYEIALAPECELFADPDCNSGGNTDLVFAGYRTGFESVSGSFSLSQYSSTGSTSAILGAPEGITCNPVGVPAYGGDAGSSQSVCDGYRQLLTTFSPNGVQLYGHRSRGQAALPRQLCITGAFGPIENTNCVQSGTGGEGLQTNIHAQDLQGLWSSVVRNDFQWPGQGWAANDGRTTTPSNYRSTLADRDYTGFNLHIPPGLTPHGGQISTGYTEGQLGAIGEAYTLAEIGL